MIKHASFLKMVTFWLVMKNALKRSRGRCYFFLFMQSQDDAKKGDFNLVTCVMGRGYQHLDETLAEN